MYAHEHAFVPAETALAQPITFAMVVGSEGVGLAIGN